MQTETLLFSRFLPGNEPCANELITASGRRLQVLTCQGQPLPCGAIFRVEAPGLFESARVVAHQFLRIRCRLVCLPGYGLRRGDRCSWRIDHEMVWENQRAQWLRSTYLFALSKKDALQELRRAVRSWRQPCPAGGRFLLVSDSTPRPRNAGPQPVRVRLTPASTKLPTPA